MADEELDNLLRENREIIDALSEVAIQQGKEKKDELKVLFTLIHRDITQEIIRAVGLEAFDNPKSLLRFNKHFANAYLQAVKNPAASPKWKKAFEECELQSGLVRQALADWRSKDLPPPSPLMTQMLAQRRCTEAEGDVHINNDMMEALIASRENGNYTVSMRDFGNMLELVQRGTKSGIKDVAPSVIGHFEAFVKQYLLPCIEETWRNNVFKQICGEEVGKPEPQFKRLIGQAETTGK